MTPEELERLAREAGYSVSSYYGISFPQHGAEDERKLLSRFAALVRAQALEDAALESEAWDLDCAAAIRALAGQPGA